MVTFCVTVADDPGDVELPEYVALMVCVPTDSVEVVHLAVPVVRVLPLPVILAPVAANATVPVAAFGETVAVKVTAVPCTDGFFDEVTVTIIASSCERRRRLLVPC